MTGIKESTKNVEVIRPPIVDRDNNLQKSLFPISVAISIGIKPAIVVSDVIKITH